jgi:hypothetical protein
MTDQQLEETIQADFDQLAYKLGGDILKGLAENYPQRFALWMADMKLKSAARYVMSFQAHLQPIDEAKSDLILAADIIDEISDEGGH